MMLRIRKVKPELFKHKDLLAAEKRFKLFLQIVFITWYRGILFWSPDQSMDQHEGEKRQIQANIASLQRWLDQKVTEGSVNATI